MRSPARLRGPCLLGICLGVASAMAPRVADARCDSNAALHACVNADSLWLPARRGSFLTLTNAETLAPGDVAFGSSASLSSKPIVLRVPSPGSHLEVPAVDKALHVSLSASVGVATDWELAVIVPLTLYQSGAGVAPYLSSEADALPRTALRDPRLGATYALLARDLEDQGDGFALAAHLDLSLPLGNADAFASEPGPVLSPTVTADFRSGPLLVGAEAGARLRTPTRFANTRLGPQAVLALGAGVDVLRETLSLAVEAFALPVLASQPSGGTLVPAEWMVTARTVPFADGAWAASLGGGTAIPLTEGAITASAWRAVLSIQYNTPP